MEEMQEKLGLNRTVWGLKWELASRAHKWEFYWYGVPTAHTRNIDCHLTPYSDAVMALPNVHKIVTSRFGSNEPLAEFDPTQMVLYSTEIIRKKGTDIMEKGEGYRLYYADSVLASPLKARSEHLPPTGGLIHENDFFGWCKSAGYGEVEGALQRLVIEVFGENAWTGSADWLVDGWQECRQVAICLKAANPTRPQSIAIYYFGYPRYSFRDFRIWGVF